MTRQERAVFLREQFEQARADALEAAYDFNRLTEQHTVKPRVIDDAAQRVILAAAEVRMAARALTLNRVRS